MYAAESVDKEESVRRMGSEDAIGYLDEEDDDGGVKVVSGGK